MIDEIKECIITEEAEIGIVDRKKDNTNKMVSLYRGDFQKNMDVLLSELSPEETEKTIFVVGMDRSANLGTITDAGILGDVLPYLNKNASNCQPLQMINAALISKMTKPLLDRIQTLRSATPEAQKSILDKISTAKSLDSQSKDLITSLLRSSAQNKEMQSDFVGHLLMLLEDPPLEEKDGKEIVQLGLMRTEKQLP